MGRGNGALVRWVFLFFLVVISQVAFGSYPTASMRLGANIRLLASSPITPPPTVAKAGFPGGSRVYHVTDYGADPTGQIDASSAIMRAVSDAFSSPSDRELMAGIKDLGGAEIHLGGGSYLVSKPIRLPSSGGGNLKIHSGSLRASDDFPTGGYLIEVQSPTPSSTADYEYITLRDLMLDANYRGGGVAVINSLRTTIDNLYITHFMTEGVFVKGGHETLVTNSYLGQHITAGGDPGEKNFSGTAIHLAGNDNSVTNVVIFSAGTGILIAGQANLISNVHCYNKATGWGGTGVYIKTPGLTQTRIVNSYMDYTGIVAEDPVQLHVSGTFFLGDAYVTLKAVKGEMKGVTIVDNMFSGSGKGVNIVNLEGKFGTVEEVVVERNDVRGMGRRATAAKGKATGNGTAWEVDFSPELLFPERIDHVEYSMRVEGDQNMFVGHAVTKVAGNKVVVGSDKPVQATVHVAVEQGM